MFKRAPYTGLDIQSPMRESGAHSHPRAAVILTGVVGIVSLVTGITYIGAPVVFAPLDPYVPDIVRAAAGFTGAVTGFGLLLCAGGLRWGYRAAWKATLMLLPASAVQALIQSSPFSAPLFLLALAAMPTVYHHGPAFRRRTRLDESQIAAGIALAGMLSYGTVGSFALREQFQAIESPLDAFYFTLVTATTVGYGDTVPLTQEARVFTLSVVVLGATSFILAAGVLLAPLLEARFKAALGKMTNSALESLSDHVVVLGYGDLTESILTELHRETDVIVVTNDASYVTALGDRGFNVLGASPRDRDALDRIHLDRARSVVVATDDDGADALAILTVRRLNPDLFIVAMATDHDNLQSLYDAGADTVISPAVLGSELLARSALEQREMTPRAHSADDD